MLLIALALMASSAILRTPTAATAAATTDRRRTLLFVDDHDVLYSAGLRRQLQPLERHSPGTPVIAADRPYEELLAYAAVHIIGGEYRMWYQAYSASASCVVCYAGLSSSPSWCRSILRLRFLGP